VLGRQKHWPASWEEEEEEEEEYVYRKVLWQQRNT
jgi:hypothetical protein